MTTNIKSFIRSFDVNKVQKLMGEKKELFERLKFDVLNGIVFPTVRKNELHFYYKGGCLFRFNGTSFFRNKEYAKYSQGTVGLNEYEKAKKENENKFTKTNGTAKERQLLDVLYGNTFNANSKSKVVVLDIEVRLNGETEGNKKCDLVLLNMQQSLPKIMFVEAKLFNDSRVNVKMNSIPEVIKQVNTYTSAIQEQDVDIIFEYTKHISICNELFATELQAPYPSSLYNFQFFGFDLFVQNHLVQNAKLIVYETPNYPNENGQHSIKTINQELGENNVMWVKQGNNPTLEEIWEALCK